MTRNEVISIYGIGYKDVVHAKSTKGKEYDHSS
jgi:hypothetical protein